MNKLFCLTLLSILCLTHAGVSLASEAELAAFIKATRAKYDLKERAFAMHDPEPILKRFYSADAISTDFEGKTRIGTAGLRPIYEDPAIIGSTVKIESIYPHVNGDIGWDWVNFHVKPASAKEKPFTFKMLFLWEKINGEWWSKGDMFTFGQFDAAAR